MPAPFELGNDRQRLIWRLAVKRSKARTHIVPAHRIVSIIPHGDTWRYRLEPIISGQPVEISEQTFNILWEIVK